MYFKFCLCCLLLSFQRRHFVKGRLAWKAKNRLVNSSLPGWACIFMLTPTYTTDTTNIHTFISRFSYILRCTFDKGALPLLLTHVCIKSNFLPISLAQMCLHLPSILLCLFFLKVLSPLPVLHFCVPCAALA